MLAISDTHLEDLRRSGLTNATAEPTGWYTERDPMEVHRRLGWPPTVEWKHKAIALGECLALRFRGADGKLNGFTRYKPDNPRRDPSNPDKVIKYERPLGAGRRAYFTLGAVKAIASPGAAIAIDEGEKKALASDQAGVPCIGLTGVFAWQEKRERKNGKPIGERKLISDLAGVDWAGRTVPIFFDFDSKRNPNVNLARAELARILTELGADVVLVDLPAGPRGDDGLPGKMGADDFIVAAGEEAFRRLMENAVRGKPSPVPLSSYREQLAASRMESVGSGEVYFDRSAPGAGKSYADMPAMEASGKSLTVLPTHENCAEAVEVFTNNGLDAGAYPPLNKHTCASYSDVEEAMGVGLPASSTACVTCWVTDCNYQARVKDAEKACHTSATHSRAALSLEKIAAGRKYVAIHEDSAPVLRPTATVSKGFEKVAAVAYAAASGVREKPDQSLRKYFWDLESAARFLAERLAGATATSALDMPSPFAPPRGADVRLLNAIRSEKVYPPADAMRICRAITAGDLAELTIRVDEVHAKGGSVLRKSILAVWQTKLPKDAAIWIADATADQTEIEAMVGRPVLDKTPAGSIKTQHPVVQVPLDIKKSTSGRSVAKIVRGVLAKWPQARQVGVICHREHVAVVEGTSRRQATLDGLSRARIAKVGYFRSGASRGSNDWINKCDLLVVLGTPRVPPAVVKSRLIQASQTAAAARDGEWQWDAWSGLTVGGQRQTVRSLAYRDRNWHAAHQSIVRAELIQAVGRGRSILESGLPVVVVTTEDLGIPLVDAVPELVSDAGVLVLRQMGELRGQNSKGVEPPELRGQNPIYIIGNCPLSSRQLATRAHLDKSGVVRTLNSLREAGLVNKVGERGGWFLTAAGWSFLGHPITFDSPPVSGPSGALASVAAASVSPANEADR